MPAPTGKQWVRLYRGLHEGENEPLYPHDIAETERPLGIHWTKSRAVAKTFAQWGGMRARNQDESDGIILEALVHRRHIIDASHPDAVDSGVYEDWHPDARMEREVTLRPGAPVHLRRVEQTYTSEADQEDPDTPPYAIDLPTSRKSVRRA